MERSRGENRSLWQQQVEERVLLSICFSLVESKRNPAWMRVKRWIGEGGATRRQSRELTLGGEQPCVRVDLGRGQPTS